MNEVFGRLEKSANSNEDDFVRGFVSSQESFFLAVNSYINIIDIHNDFSEVSYRGEPKTKIFRNPIYIQTCEDCLMNFYRCFLAILSSETDKNYTNQRTLGQAIPALKSYGFHESTNIDANIRNSINHGNVFPSENRMVFKFKDGKDYKTKELSIWDYDNLINDAIDIAGGILAGFIKLFSKKHDFLVSILSSTFDENYKFEWFKLFGAQRLVL